MHRTDLSFLLVTAFFLCFLCFPGLAAVPTSQPRSFTFPLRSLHSSHVSRDIGPGTNRAVRRLDRMTGRAVPNDEEHHKILYSNSTINDTEIGGTTIKHSRRNDSTTPAITSSPSNSVGMAIGNNQQAYIIHVQIGTPPTSYQIAVDIGGTDLWVTGDQCRELNVTSGILTGNGCGTQTLTSGLSSTFTDTTQPWNPAASLNGTLATDTVTIAGLTLTGYEFGVALIESTDQIQIANFVSVAGSIGMGRGNLTQQGGPPFVPTLRAQNVIDHAVVGYKIPRLLDQKNDGEMTIGAPDPSKFDPSTLVTMANINKQNAWEVDIGSIQVNGQVAIFLTRTAVFTTSTPWILAPQSDAETIHQRIPGAQSRGSGAYLVPCNTSAVVSFTFVNQSFSIDSRDMAIPVGLSNGMCGSGIGAGSDTDAWQLGSTFLRNAYLVTDFDENVVSLAKLL